MLRTPVASQALRKYNDFGQAQVEETAGKGTPWTCPVRWAHAGPLEVLTMIMAIQLTDEQRQAVEAQEDRSVEVVDPATNTLYVLMAAATYERMRALVEQGAQRGRSETAPGVPAGIRRAQEVFWRDLPELLKKKRNRGKWVCYLGNERVGIGGTEAELLRKCRQRDAADNEFYTDVIFPYDRPPWEPERIDQVSFEFQAEPQKPFQNHL